MLATEVLREGLLVSTFLLSWGIGRTSTHSADDIVIIRKMRLALLASKDFIGSEVDVIRETHYDLL